MESFVDGAKLVHFDEVDVLFGDFSFISKTVFELAKLANELDPFGAKLFDAVGNLSFF